MEHYEPCRSRIDGDVVPRLVIGTTGQRYHGREVVACVLPPGLFGTRKGKRSRNALLCLHNGMLNQCNLSEEGEPPTPYWAVLDAAIALKSGFVRRDVIDLAVKTVGEEKRRACEMAWDIIRNHHRHARKKDAGMAYMMDQGEDGKLMVRARDEVETMQYFEGQGELRESAEAALADTVELEVAEPVEV